MVQKKRKLLLISDLYPYFENPIKGIFVRQQAQELAKYFQIQVIATYDGHPYKIDHHRQDGFPVELIFYPYWQRHFLTSLVTFKVLALPAIKRYYKNFRPDLIHIQDYRHIPELFWLKPWLNKLPVLKYLTLHNIRTHPDKLKNNSLVGFYVWALKRTLSGWDHIFTVNSRLARWVEKYNPKNRVTVLGNGVSDLVKVDLKLIEPYKNILLVDYFHLISVGNLVPEKGFNDLIESVSILKKESLAVQLIIVGEGKIKKDLEQQIKNKQLTKEVTLLGRIENNLLRNLLPLFDIFVLASYSETFGIVYLEAMYAGLPVIGIKNEGIYGFAEEGKQALFAEPQNSRDFADKIQLLIKKPALREEIAKAGQQLVQEQFMLNKLIQRVVAIYEQE